MSEELALSDLRVLHSILQSEQYRSLRGPTTRLRVTKRAQLKRVFYTKNTSDFIFDHIFIKYEK